MIKTMRLNVVPKSRSAASLWQVFYDLEYDWALAMGDEISLSGALAISNSLLPKVWDANRVFVTAGDFGELMSDVNSANIRPVVWDVSRMSTGREAMETALLANGFRRQDSPVQALQNWVGPKVKDPTPHGPLMILPARSARRHYESLCRQWVSEDAQDAELADAMLLHLDDPKFDSRVAMIEGRPVGMAGLQSRGETGRLEDVYVIPELRSRGIGSQLIGRAIELAARAQLKSIFVVTSPGNEKARSLYTRLGFATIGNYSVFVRPDA